MPDSITVAAFVFGLVLLIAALIGKELKIAAVEMPALDRMQRLIVGALGVFLVIFGLTEGQGFGWVDNQEATATVTAAIFQTTETITPVILQATEALPPAAVEPTEVATPAILSDPAEETSTNPGELPTPASLLNSIGIGLPPEFAGNIRSAKATYGCGVLLGTVSNNDEQLSVCGLMPSVPAEWITKVKRVNVDCATLAFDRIIVEVWTEANYSGEAWGYTFECPLPPVQTTP